MNAEQREIFRQSIINNLQWKSDRVIWDGTPLPVMAGYDSTREGLVVLSVVSSVHNGTSDGRRTSWSGDPPVRTVVITKTRITTIQCDVYTLDPSIDAFDIWESIVTLLQEETTEATHEEAQISLCEIGNVKPAPFRADGGFFSRVIGELSCNVAWSDIDRTAPEESIGSVGAVVDSDP